MEVTRWIAMTLIVAHIGAQDQLRINYGVHFEHVTSTARLLNDYVRHVFHVPLPPVPSNITLKPLPVCRLLRPRVADDTCDGIRKMAPSLIDVNAEIISKIRDSLLMIYELIPEAKLTSGSRERKGLFDLGGKALKFLLGTLDSDDLHTLEHHLRQLKHSIVEDHKTVELQSKRIGTFMQVANYRLDTIAATINEQHDLLMSFVNESALLATEITVTRAMLFTAHNRTLQYITALDHLNQFRQAIEALRNGHLSPSLIPHREMVEALEQAEKHLYTFCPECIPVSKDPAYFYGKIDFAFTRQAQSLLILVKIPFSTTAVRFNVYNIYSWPVPVLLTNHVTKLQSLARAIAVPRPFYGDYFLYLNGKPTITGQTLLNIDNAIGMSVKHWSCELALLEDQTAKISSLCQTYVYSDQLQPSVLRINQSHIVLTNMSQARFTCVNKSQEVIPACQYCLFQVPCHCSVTIDHVTIATRFAGCRGNDSQSPAKFFATNMALLTKIFQPDDLLDLSASSLLEAQLEIKIPTLRIQSRSYNKLNTLVHSQVHDLDRVVELSLNHTGNDWLDDEFDQDSHDYSFFSLEKWQTILVIASLSWSLVSALFAIWVARKLRSHSLLLALLQGKNFGPENTHFS